MPSVIAHITPRVFAWARESAGYTVAEVANRLNRDSGEVHAWEEEDGRFPTLPQAKQAANLFGRPVGVFFLAEPPDEKILPEFRVLPGASQKQSPQLRRFARHVVHRCEWAASVLAAEGGKPLAVIGKANLRDDDPAEVAIKIREWLSAPLAETISQKNIGDALQWWTKKIESAGVFVFGTNTHRHRTVPIDEMRGLAEINPIAPAVAVNAADAVSARIFTLIHEVAHLWLRREGITRGDSFAHFIAHRGQPKNADAKTEMFCNRVAAATLMPTAEFRDAWNAQTAEDIEVRINIIAARFHVSRTAAARRAADHQIIAWQQCEELHRKYHREWEERKKKEKAEQKGFGVKRHKTLLKQNGWAFSRLALSAYYGGDLHPMKAVALLGAKRHDHIEDMAEEILP